MLFRAIIFVTKKKAFFPCAKWPKKAKANCQLHSILSPSEEVFHVMYLLLSPVVFIYSLFSENFGKPDVVTKTVRTIGK